MYARVRRGLVVALACEACCVPSENAVTAATETLARAFYLSALMGRREAGIARVSSPEPRCIRCGRSVTLGDSDAHRAG